MLVGILTTVYSLTIQDDEKRDSLVNEVKQHFVDNYKPAATVMDEAVDAAISRTGYLAKLMKKRRVQPSTSESMADEFGRFVLVPISDVDPLAWWKANEPTFPRLARMARDFLAAPAGEVAAERMFASGRRLISWERGRLLKPRCRLMSALKAGYRSSHNKPFQADIRKLSG